MKTLFARTCFLLTFVIIGVFLWSHDLYAEVDLNAAGGGGIDAITSNGAVAMEPISSGGDFISSIQSLIFRFFHGFKILASGLAVIYLVYEGLSMVMSMGDDQKLKTSKQQIYYTIIAFLFINIPEDIYSIFADKSKNQVGSVTNSVVNNYADIQNNGVNMLVNFGNWQNIIGDGVFGFIRVLVYGIGVAVIIFAGIKLITSHGSEDSRKSAKHRLVYTSVALVFFAFIQPLVQFAASGNIHNGQDMLARGLNILIFIAGPIAIFFFILGGYYYLTSAGNEDRAKKGKGIVVNTVIAIIILFAAYTFLKDLITFTP